MADAYYNGEIAQTETHTTYIDIQEKIEVKKPKKGVDDEART